MKGKTTTSKTPWVVAGGKIGEMAHCERCGTGLDIGGTQPIPIVVAAMKAFVGMHRNCKEGGFKEPEAVSPQQWVRGRDVGTSSLTIYAVAFNTPSPHSRYDVPHDPDDFGRCYRLIKAFPYIEWRLGDVANRFPEWVPFVREWQQLTAEYEDAIKTPRAPATVMYEHMKRLEAEGYALKEARDE